MVDEMSRSISQLQLSNLDKPYFIQYIVLDEDEFAARATFGAITQSSPTKQRLIYSQVRVGNYDFDNTEFQAGGQGGAGGGNPGLYQGPVDDDYDSLRHTLWLATDASYKSAIEVIAQKRASIQNRTQEDRVPDFTKESPTVSVGERRKLEFDRAKIEGQLRQWSQIFREFPNIQSSSVSIRARLNHRYVVNSEGTRTMAPELLIILQASATAQAADGMVVSNSVPIYARDFCRSAVHRSLRGRHSSDGKGSHGSARSARSRFGLLRSGAAGRTGCDRNVRARARAEPHRAARSSSRNGQSATPPLEDRLNRPILPSYMSVVDDPTVKSFNSKKLIGYYTNDDQGVPAKRVSLVDGGLLTDFLMSRRPGKGRLQSNGHGRNGYPGRETPQIGNLIVTAKDGKSPEELKKELLKAAKEERLEYGIIIRASNSGGYRAGRYTRDDVSASRSPMEKKNWFALPGAGGISVQGLRHLLAVGNDSTAANRLVGTSGAETPTSVVAPSVLVEEISLDKPSGTQQKPSLITHPFFGN